MPDFSGYPVTDPEIFLSSQEFIGRMAGKSEKIVSPEDIRELVDSLAGGWKVTPLNPDAAYAADLSKSHARHFCA